MKMKFKDFEFPINPNTIEVKASTNIKLSPTLNGNSAIYNSSINPTVITGSGVFYGNKGESYCIYLQHLLRQRTAGALMLPSAVGMDAYLIELNYKKDTNLNQISYTFKFVEKCSKKEAKSFVYTYANDNENAFDIAHRCGVSVDKIMQNNDFATPFSIASGNKVRLL